MRFEESNEDFAEAKAAIATLGVTIVLGLHLVSWLFLAFAASGDSAPERTCACPFQSTAWTFVFWAPEMVLLAGIAGALAARRFRGYVITGAILAAIALLFLVDHLYLADVRRVWSLPPLPRI
jgi:hypothetical protein